MQARVCTVSTWFVVLISLALSGCAAVKSESDITKKDFPVVIYVSRQNDNDINPINIVVLIDQKKILDKDFKVGGGNYNQEIKLVLKGGTHQLEAQSSNGDAGLDVVFTVEKPTWLALSYWGKNHYQLNISYTGFVFL